MSFTVLIPARLASSRLPDKPLADLAGLPMVVRVARQAAASGAAQVVVAADHARILDACAAHGVTAVMTRADHASGSDRLAEACEQLRIDGDDIVVNVQGDEPLIEPGLIGEVAQLLRRHPDCSVGTAAHAIDDAEAFGDPNVVKVVTDAAGRALYFSRAPIPWWRDASRRAVPALPLHAARRHIGLYSYRASFLRLFPTLAPAPLERIESLEQLRVLWHGHRIAVHDADIAPGPGVDTPEDLARVRSLLAADQG